MAMKNDKKSNEERYVEEKARELHRHLIYYNHYKVTSWAMTISECEDFIRTIRNDCKVKVSREFIGKVTARIYCDRKSVRAIKENVREAFEEAGIEVADK